MLTTSWLLLTGYRIIAFLPSLVAISVTSCCPKSSAHCNSFFCLLAVKFLNCENGVFKQIWDLLCLFPRDFCFHKTFLLALNAFKLHGLREKRNLTSAIQSENVTGTIFGFEITTTVNKCWCRCCFPAKNAFCEDCFL